MCAAKTAITPTREQDFPEWYQQVVKAAEMAENSAVRGCMVIKPHGYAIWEIVQRELDDRIKANGVENAYFPLLIPLSYIAKEAEHIDGFATECAVVTHHRLEDDNKGGLKPAGELAEPFIVRPTSETIIGESMAKWINSYRDLPLKLNQWANVMRWEMRPRVFLRTSEFLWQEGHNAFATAEEAREDAYKMLDVYVDVQQNILAIPGFKGEKTADERFPGAIATYSYGAMMQDGKALQACTSHDLGQTFSKGFDIKYQAEDGDLKHAWTTSWGLSTRVIGGLIMVHSDDDGLRLPPRAAPQQVVILPFIKDDSDKAKLFPYGEQIVARLAEKGVRAKLDTRDGRAGDKRWSYIKKGIPVIAEIGGREMDNNTISFIERTDISKEGKQTVSVDEFVTSMVERLEAMQKSMFEMADKNMRARVQDVSSIEELDEYFKKPAPLGFARMDKALLDDPKFADVKKAHSITPRCLPFEDEGQKVLIGKSY